MVVIMPPSNMFKVLQVAKEINMTDDNYVWICAYCIASQQVLNQSIIGMPGTMRGLFPAPIPARGHLQNVGPFLVLFSPGPQKMSDLFGSVFPSPV